MFFQVGNHATTFGGTPLACAASLAVLDTIEQEDLLKNATAMGTLLKERLEKATKKDKRVTAVRGMGLMVGMVLDQPAIALQKIIQEQGLLVLATAGNVIRFLPPLNVKASQVRKAVTMVKDSLALWDGSKPGS